MKYNEFGFFDTIPLSRGILDHIIEGKLSNREFSLLVYCILKANYRTGYFSSCSSIIARELHLPAETVKRLLRTLFAKGYLKTFPGKRNWAYPILVNKFPTPQGEVDIFRTDTIFDVCYVQRGPSKGISKAPQVASAPPPKTTGKSSAKELQAVPSRTFRRSDKIEIVLNNTPAHGGAQLMAPALPGRTP